ncbi:MAG: hypothetical protein JRN20_18815 [Nitrososphaerota archaeon]|nr:hypothetical protein [Nitrososphaerota archaeon]
MSVQREVIVNSVEGELNSGDTSLNLSYFYPRGANGQIFFKQGESFYIYLYFEGNGNVQDVSVTTPGFVGQVLAPPLPLSVDNSTEPSVVILQIFATSCCFNGTVNFNVNATP